MILLKELRWNRKNSNIKLIISAVPLTVIEAKAYRKNLCSVSYFHQKLKFQKLLQECILGENFFFQKIDGYETVVS